jgi:phosphomannomutase
VIESGYAPDALRIDRTDGLSFEYADWRFNLRASNTEPLIRLNVEARGSLELMRTKTDELLGVLKSHGAVATDH